MRGYGLSISAPDYYSHLPAGTHDEHFSYLHGGLTRISRFMAHERCRKPALDDRSTQATPESIDRLVERKADCQNRVLRAFQWA
jgi:hypothetical protein